MCQRCGSAEPWVSPVRRLHPCGGSWRFPGLVIRALKGGADRPGGRCRVWGPRCLRAPARCCQGVPPWRRRGALSSASAGKRGTRSSAQTPCPSAAPCLPPPPPAPSDRGTALPPGRLGPISACCLSGLLVGNQVPKPKDQLPHCPFLRLDPTLRGQRGALSAVGPPDLWLFVRLGRPARHAPAPTALPAPARPPCLARVVTPGPSVGRRRPRGRGPRPPAALPAHTSWDVADAPPWTPRSLRMPVVPVLGHDGGPEAGPGPSLSRGLTVPRARTHPAPRPLGSPLRGRRPSGTGPLPWGLCIRIYFETVL